MSLEKYIPTMYRKDIFDIDYKILHKRGIKCLLFDLDNTIMIVDNSELSNEVTTLFETLKKDFHVVIVSNNLKKRVSIIAKKLNVEFISFAVKPFSWKIRRFQKKYQYENKKICMIGDQMISDVLVGSRLKFLTILVDPLSKKDLQVTKINRFLEKRILRKLRKNNSKFRRGNYYE